MTIPDWLKTSLTGFLQVSFVAFNSYTIAHFQPVAAFVSSFAISFVWTHNVRRAAFGGEGERLAYCFGAAAGCVVGMYSAAWILG